MVDTRDCNASEPRSKRRQVRTWLGIGVCAAAALLLLAACGNGGSQAKSGGENARGGPGGRGGPGSIPVQAVSVQYGPLDAVHNVAGSVVPVTQSQVAAQVSGVVRSIVHQAGDWVKAGDTIVQLDDSQLQLAVQNAQVSLKNAEINLTVGQQNTGYDTKKLQLQLQSAQSALAAAQKNYDALDSGYKQGTVSASSVDTAQSQLQTAQANYESAKTALDQNKNAETQSIAQLKLAVETAQNQLAQAKLNLQDASIAAPFAGQISVVNVTPGEFVGQNTPAFLLVSSDREINFSVPPTDAPVLSVGKSVSFAVGGQTYSATVNQTPSAPVNGVVPLTARLTGATSQPFGTVGTVSYPVTVSTGTLVPLAALQNDGSQNYIFTIEKGKAHVQPVTILGETGSTASVNRLPNGTSVIINPPPGLLEGTSVTPAGGSGQGGGGAASGGQAGAQGAAQSGQGSAQGAAHPQNGQGAPQKVPSGGQPRSGGGSGSAANAKSG